MTCSKTHDKTKHSDRESAHVLFLRMSRLVRSRASIDGSGGGLERKGCIPTRQSEMSLSGHAQMSQLSLRGLADAGALWPQGAGHYNHHVMAPMSPVTNLVQLCLALPVLHSPKAGISVKFSPSSSLDILSLNQTPATNLRGTNPPDHHIDILTSPSYRFVAIPRAAIHANSTQTRVIDRVQQPTAKQIGARVDWGVNCINWVLASLSISHASPPSPASPPRQHRLYRLLAPDKPALL